MRFMNPKMILKNGTTGPLLRIVAAASGVSISAMASRTSTTTISTAATTTLEPSEI